MKLNKLFLSSVAMLMMLPTANAENTISNARIYINPGHGGWTANDRPLATINYAVKDTLGFFETNTNLLKGLSLHDQMVKAGAAFVKMSRTANGYVSSTDANKTTNDKIETADQIVTLSAVCQDVETNNMDYFISIHSNATTYDATTTNYPLVIYRGTDAASGNGLTNARDMARSAWKYINANGITYKSAYQGAGDNNTRGDISMYGSSSTNSMGYTGYLGVLKHGCDGFLSEGAFHTYQAERQRLLNRDYCYQEGIRYSRAIRDWFGDNTETVGYIMGTVKDISGPLENALYNYKVNSIDAYAPLNKVQWCYKTKQVLR